MSNQNDNPYRPSGATSMDEARPLVGIDLYSDPQSMSGEMLLDAQNFVNLDGRLFVRPGLMGLFGGNPPSSSSSMSGASSSSSNGWYDVGNTLYSVPSGGPSYGLDYLEDGNGNAWIIFVNGGKIYKTQEGSGGYTELLDTSRQSYNFNGPLTDSSKFGNFLYLADGAHPTTRITLNGGFPAYEMYAPGAVPPDNNPKVSPLVTLTNTPLWAANNAANWSFDGQATPYSNIAPNAGQDLSGNTQVINGSNLRGNGWVVTGEEGPRRGGYPDEVNVIGAGVNICVAGTPPGGASTGQGGLINVQALSGNSSLYPSRFHILLYCVKNDFGSNPNSYSANCFITPYDAGGNRLGAAFAIAINPPGNTGLVIDTVADFSGFGPSVAGITVQIVANNTNSVGNLYVGPISITPVSVQTTFVTGTSAVNIYPSLSGSQIIASSSSSVAGSSSSSMSGTGVTISNPPSDLGTTLDYQGTSLIFTFPIGSSSSSMSGASSSSSGTPEGGSDLSRVNQLVITLGPTGVVNSWANLSFSLSLRQATGGSGSRYILADNGVSVSSDGTALVCDISTLPTSDLTNIIGFKLTFLSNVVWNSPFYALQLGPVITPGNLSENDAGYVYYTTETAVIDSQNRVESNPSLPSETLNPSFSAAEVLLTIPTGSPWNAPTNQYNIYRLGGVDTYPILVASVSKTVSVAYGADPTNPYYSWNAITGQFLDNTPDLFLSTAPLLSFSKDPMPPNAQAIEVWQGRLWVAVGNRIYASWLANSDNSAPLMTTYIQNTDDPNIEIEGANFPIDPDSSNPVVRLVKIGTPIASGNQFGGVLIAFNKRSVYFVQGEQATDFTCKPYPYAAGIGLVAFRGVAVVSASQAYFMGPDRIHVCPPQGYEYYTTGVEADNPQQDIGLLIKPALYPSPPNTPLQNSIAFAQSFLMWHSSRLYLGCPNPGDTSNDVLWIYDFLTPGWLRWTGPTSFGSSSSSSPGSSSSSSGGGLAVSGIPMAFGNALSLPPIPGTTGAAYNLYLFGLNGQVYQNIGAVDIATPLSAATNIPWLALIHAMRPGFFVRYRKRPLYYMRARLEWYLIDLVFTGTVTMVAQAYTAGIQSPVPIAGAVNTQYYQLASLGRPFTVYVPPGLIEGDMVTIQISGQANAPAYLRGVRGMISQTNYEHT